MRKLTKVLSALIVLVLATAFIGCGNPSSSDNGGGNSNSSTYTLTTGRVYLNLDEDYGFVFNDDYSVSSYFNSTTQIMGDRKWRVSGYTVEIYSTNTNNPTHTFTANSDFTQLTLPNHVSGVFTLQ